MKKIIKRGISFLMSVALCAAALPVMAEENNTSKLVSVTTDGIKLQTENTITSAACYKSLSDAWNQNNAVIDCTVNDGNEIEFDSEIGSAINWSESFYVRCDTENGEPIYKKLVYKKLFSEDFESYNGNYELNDIIPQLKNLSDLYHTYGIWKDNVWPGSYTMRSSGNDFMLKLLPSKDYKNIAAEYSIKNTNLGTKSEDSISYKDIVGFVVGYVDGDTLNTYKPGHPAFTGTAESGWISDNIGYVEMGFDMDSDIYIGARKQSDKSYGEERKSTVSKGLTAEDSVGVHRIKMSRCNDFMNFYWTQKDRGITDCVTMDMSEYAIKDRSYVTIAATPGMGYNDGAIDNLLLYTWEDKQEELDNEINNIRNGIEIITSNIKELRSKYSQISDISLIDEDKIKYCTGIYNGLPEELKANLSEEDTQYLESAENRIKEIKRATQNIGFALLRRTSAGYIYSFTDKLDINSIKINSQSCTDYITYDKKDKHYICVPEKYITDEKNIIEINKDIQILTNGSEAVNDEDIVIVSNDSAISVDNNSKTISGAVFGDSFENLADKMTMPLDCELASDETSEKLIIKKIFEDDKKQEYTVIYNHYITVKSPYILDDTDRFEISGIPFEEKLDDFINNINYSDKVDIKINGNNLKNAAGIVRNEDVLDIYIKGEQEPKQTFKLITADRPTDFGIASTVYGIEDNVINGVKKGTSYKEFISALECTNGILKVYDSDMQEKNYGTMDGGETVKVFARYPKINNVFKSYNICYDEELYNDIITNSDTKNFSISGRDIQKTTSEYPGYNGKPSILWSEDGKIEFRSNAYSSKCAVSVEAYAARSYNSAQTEYSIYVGDKLILSNIKIDNGTYATSPQFVKLADVEVDGGEYIRVCSKSIRVPFSAVRFSDNRAAYISSVNINGNEVIEDYGKAVMCGANKPFNAKIAFAANMESGTVNTDNVRLVSENGYKLSCNIEYDSQENVYSVTANEKLKKGINYYFQISDNVKTADGYKLVRYYTVPINTENKENHIYAKRIYTDNKGYAEYSVDISESFDKNLSILIASYYNGFGELYKKKISEIPNINRISVKATKDNDNLSNIKIFVIDGNYKLYDIADTEEGSK